VVFGLIFDDQIPGSPGIPVPPTYSAIPRMVEVARNDARTADTCSLELDYRDFPLDPRAIRGAHVTVHIDDVLDPSIPLVPSRLNARFIGLVDEVEASHDSDGEQVSIRCRDYTAIAIDTKWAALLVQPLAPAPPLPFPIAGTLQSVIEAIRVLVWPLTLPAIYLDPTVPAQPLGAKIGRKFWTAKPDDTVWDVLTDMCAVFGQVPVWNLDQLEIRPPAFPKPSFASLVYGQNLEKLTFKRDYRDKKAKPIKVVAWNPLAGVALEAQYPPIGDPRSVKKSQKAGVGGVAGAGGAATPQTSVDYLQYNVEGNYTPVDLLAIAIALYNESKQETTGTFETRELSDGFLVPLLGLSNGDPISITLWPDTHAAIEGMSPPEAIAFLSDPFRPNALDPVVATALVDSWAKARTLATLWHIKSTTLSWSVDDGVKISANFENYLLE
jgi:hypothetical protein